MAAVEIEVLESSCAEEQRLQGQPVRLPECYNEYAILARHLEECGIWDWLKLRVLARRAGAYELCDLVAFLVCYFCSANAGESLGDFADRSAPYGAELAGLVGRLRWMSQGSLSRGLGSVDPPLAQEVSRYVLLQSSAETARSSLVAATGYTDGLGDRWDVFHWDTTVTTLRERALPEDPELPEPIRLARRMAAPGYPGRKRGDLQTSRSTVSEAATGVWLEVDIQPGNGDLHEQIRGAAAVTCAYLDVDRDPARRDCAVVVCDGVSGGVPQAVELRRSKLMFLTRSNAYPLLEAPTVRSALETGLWSAVQDSLSGPRREAMELGTHEVADALRCRLIVSRFAVGRKNRGAGKAIGQWKYELYLTDLPESRWAAADAVTLYYGRTALENRFAAEDRDFGLDRVFSYNTPGQALACAVALMIWNLRLVLGLRLVAEEIPPRAARHRPCLAMATPPSGEAEPPQDESAPAESPVDPVGAQGGAAERTSSTRLDLGPQPDTTNGSAPPESPVPRTPADHTAVMDAWCDEHPGWSSRPDVPALLCPKGQPLRLSAIRHMSRDLAFLRFRATSQACDTCPIRPQCAPKSHAQHLRREVNVPVTAPTLFGATPTSVPSPLPSSLPSRQWSMCCRPRPSSAARPISSMPWPSAASR
jgi:hypothetical protein